MNEALPEDTTVDNSKTESYFREKVDAGLKELDEGNWILHEEIEKRMARWLKK